MMWIVRIAACLQPRLCFSPGYANAAWQLDRGLDAVPLNINTEDCHKMAASALAAMNAEDSDWLAHRASPPRHFVALSLDERDNLLLVGNTIEGGIHSQSVSKPSSWKSFYEKLVDIALAAPQPFRQESFRNFARDGRASLYQTLCDEAAKTGSLIFPDSPMIAHAVDGALRQIAGRKYRGSAANLASALFRRPSLERALRRLQKFPEMSFGAPKPMAPQFLKLAVRWGVWPTIQTGPLIFPSRAELNTSTGLVALLLDSGCLRAGPETDLIPNDVHFKRMAIRAVYCISTEVGKVLQSSTQPRLERLRDEELGAAAGAVREWKLYELVDYFLWQLGMRKNALPRIERTWSADKINATRKK